jgi:uncharacterized membrane protein
MLMSEPRYRLDQPRGERRGPLLRVDPEAFGKWTERMARYFGTARYLVIQTIVVLVWIAFNIVAVSLRFDPYPFILLNLAFSTQAAYAAPLILLAQNRQEGRDRVQAEADRDEARQAKADLEYLAREIASVRMSLGEVATRDFLRSEITRLESLRDGREGKEPKPKEAKASKERKAATAESAAVTSADVPPPGAAPTP